MSNMIYRKLDKNRFNNVSLEDALKPYGFSKEEYEKNLKKKAEVNNNVK